MATASHDHLPDLSASLSKSHHRAPISDLWGPSLNSKVRTTDSSSDYALEIAADSSRGPLMSSASSVHGPLVDDVHGSHPATGISKDSSSAALSASALWPTSSPVTGPTPVPGVPLSSAVGTGPVRSVGSAPMGAPTSTGSGIWGPRQSFSGFSSTPGFVPASAAASTSYPGGASSASSWMMDGNTSAAAAGSATPLGIHGLSPAVSGSPAVSMQSGYYVPSGPASLGSSMSSVSGSSMGSAQKLTPPRSSPSPPHAAVPGMPSAGPRLYAQSGQPAQQSVPAQQQSAHQQHVGHHHGGQQQQHQQQHQHNHGGHQMMMRGQYPHDNQAFMRPFKKNGRPSTNTELYKTELCASYMSTGGNCPYGEKCQFAHGPQELKTVDRPPKWRSKPCQNWVRTGTCSYNERCCFRHDVPVGYDQQQ